MMQWVSDVRHSWRALVRTPGFLVTSVATLALAIGAVVGMFSVVNTVLLQPLPFRDSSRLVVLAGTAPEFIRAKPPVTQPALCARVTADAQLG